MRHPAPSLALLFGLAALAAGGTVHADCQSSWAQHVAATKEPPLDPNALVGRWVSSKYGAESFVFKADGKFVKTPAGTGNVKMHQTGTWKLEGRGLEYRITGQLIDGPYGQVRQGASKVVREKLKSISGDRMVLAFCMPSKGDIAVEWKRVGKA